MELTSLLKKLDACGEAQKWASGQPDLQAAWSACKRSDWMLWLLARTVVHKTDPRLRLMACDFGEAVLHLVPEGEDRPRKAIEVARRFANGEATEEELAAARDAAWDAAWAAARAAARDAAWDAARAAARAAARDAAWAAAWDAAWAAARDAARAAAWDAAWDAARAAARAAARDAARAAAWAAARAAAWDAAWDAARDAQANIIRSYFPECPEIAAKHMEVAS